MIKNQLKLIIIDDKRNCIHLLFVVKSQLTSKKNNFIKFR